MTAPAPLPAARPFPLLPRGRVACLRPSRAGARRGVAAVEFALIVPLILLMFGGVADLGLGVWARGTLTTAVSQGAYYAILVGPSVAPAKVQTLVQNASTLSGVTATVTTPATYCASGSPATLTATASTQTCADGTTPGTYTTIGASYAMTPILPAFTGFGTTTLKESVTVRLQ